MTQAKAEAIANADTRLTDAGLPAYTELLAAVQSLRIAVDRPLTYVGEKVELCFNSHGDAMSVINGIRSVLARAAT